MGLFNLFKPAKTVLVVDGVSLNESMGMKGKVPPRNQLQVLRRLSRFAQREKVEMVVVLSGAPLNKAPAGKKFEEVAVIYSKSAEEHARFLAKTTAAKGAGAILISSNTAAEKIIGGRANKMRVSSFKKAFDASGGGELEGSERGGNNRSRPPRKRQPRPQQAEQNERRNEKRNSNSSSNNNSNKNSETDAINELIDLVD